jgi:hypothetical protein
MEVVVLNLQISPQLEQSLRSIAQQKHISLDAAAIEALQNYVQEQSAEIEPEKVYSFIGIAHSRKGNAVKKKAALKPAGSVYR